MSRMMRGVLVLVVAVGLGAVGGCGDSAPADSAPADSAPADSGPADSGPADSGPAAKGSAGTAGGSKEDQAKAVVLKMLDLVRGGQQADAAGLIAYRGKDEKRRWTDSSNYANAEEKRHVDRVCARIASLQAKGAPSFEKFESEKESEGEWLVWHVRFGEGEGAKKVAFACINNAGTTLLGDID